VQYTGLNTAVLGHGKSLSLRSHKSCGHGGWWNVKGSACTYVGHYSDIWLYTSGFGEIAESRDCTMQYTGLNTAVLGHGKSLLLHSRKSCGHGDPCHVKGSVYTYIGHHCDIRHITSGFGVIAEICHFLACNAQALIVSTGKTRLTLLSVTSSVICTW